MFAGPALGRPATLPTTVLIIGERSNLSRRLAERLPGGKLLSVGAVTADFDAGSLPDEPYALVINSFQPATRLSDVSDPVGYVDVSLAATARLLAAMPGTPCVKIVYTSSASVYGNNGHCAESDPVTAGDLHSALKLANERLVQSCCQAHGVDVTITRVFNMYGGEDRFSVVSKLLAAARARQTFTLVNDGSAVRDFVHVDDVATVYEAVLGLRNVPLLNVGAGHGIAIRALVEELNRRGIPIRTETSRRFELELSTADVTMLARYVDVHGFRRVVDFVGEQAG